jgi:hypothetical protein
LPDDLLEELQSKLRDFFERSDPLEPDTWDPEILCLTERLILDGNSVDNTTNEEISRALFELMSRTFIEWQRRSGWWSSRNMAGYSKMPRACPWHLTSCGRIELSKTTNLMSAKLFHPKESESHAPTY